MIGDRPKMVAFDVRPKFCNRNDPYDPFFTIYNLEEYCFDARVTRVCLKNKLFFKITARQNRSGRNKSLNIVKNLLLFVRPFVPAILFSEPR